MLVKTYFQILLNRTWLFSIWPLTILMSYDNHLLLLCSGWWITMNSSDEWRWCFLYFVFTKSTQNNQNPMFSIVSNDLFPVWPPPVVVYRLSPRNNGRSFVRRDILSSNAPYRRSNWRYCARRAIIWLRRCTRRWIGWVPTTSTSAIAANAITSPSNTIARRGWASLYSAN